MSFTDEQWKRLNEQFEISDNKIEALELAIKNSPPNSHLKEQIAEIRNRLFLVEKADESTVHNITKIKEKLNEVAQSRIGWEENIENNYRELLKKYSECEDSTIHKNFFLGLLEKLDSPKKTEKKKGCECGHSVLVHDPVSCRYCECLIYKKTEKKDLCKECGGYRMGERMMHKDSCSQCTTGTTAEKLPEPLGVAWLDESEEGYKRTELTQEDFDKKTTTEPEKKVIEEFLEDLKELRYGFDMNMFNEKIKKWQGRVK